MVVIVSMIQRTLVTAGLEKLLFTNSTINHMQYLQIFRNNLLKLVRHLNLKGN